MSEPFFRMGMTEAEISTKLRDVFEVLAIPAVEGVLSEYKEGKLEILTRLEIAERKADLAQAEVRGMRLMLSALGRQEPS